MNRRLSCVLCTVAAIALVVPTLLIASHPEAEYSEALASYFNVSDKDLNDMKATGIAAEDLPVALQIAKLAKTSPVTMARLRARGDSWSDIAAVRHLGGDSFYMILGKDFTSRTYSPIMDKFHSTPKSNWYNVRLTDDDIVNLVNLKFISSHNDFSAYHVMSLRDQGGSFPDINTRTMISKAELIKKEREKRRAAVMGASMSN